MTLPELHLADWRPTKDTLQHGEGSEAYEAFLIYRDLGVSRSQAAVSSELGKSRTLVSRWSMDWNWVERIAEWEIEQDRLDRELLQQERAKALKRHRAIAAALTIPVLQRLQGDADRGIQKLDPNALTPEVIARFAETGVRIERLAYVSSGSVSSPPS